MSSLISTTTPLTGSASFISTVQQTTRATAITGSVFADQSGTLWVDQSGDGVDWDISNSYAVTGGTGYALNVPLLTQFIRIRYINGATAQATFRLFVDLRDPYGDFLLAAEAPSSGGAYIVLYLDPASQEYIVSGRFDGTDGWNVNGNAAIYANVSGQYASFLVANATVTVEELETTTSHTPTSF